MRVMAIDIGTNSTLHLVAEATGGEVAVVERGIVGNGLGAGLTRDGLITPTVLDENRWILERLLRRGAELGCVRSGAVGTHALRRAGNREEFIRMTDRLGLWLKVISENLHERRTIPGMPPARAESIHAGALILNELLKIIRCSSVIVSEKGVLFGLALRLAGDEI